MTEDAKMENARHFDGASAAAFGGDDIPTVARHQLVGSLVAIALIAAAASVTALRPVRHETAAVGRQSFAIVQKPSFVVPPGLRVAAIARRQIDLP
jgi:hypothetical protein